VTVVNLGSMTLVPGMHPSRTKQLQITEHRQSAAHQQYREFCMSEIDPRDRGALLRFDDAVPNRVAYELAHRMQIELGQDVCAVCLRSLGGHPEDHTDLLVGLAFGEEL